MAEGLSKEIGYYLIAISDFAIRAARMVVLTVFV